MARVLNISNDDGLGKTRTMILERAGHRVVTAFSLQEVERACAGESFEVVVIGQGVPKRDRARISEVVRAECPSAKLLELYLPSIGKNVPHADESIEVPFESPADLADWVKALAPKRRARRRKS